MDLPLIWIYHRKSQFCTFSRVAWSNDADKHLPRLDFRVLGPIGKDLNNGPFAEVDWALSSVLWTPGLKRVPGLIELLIVPGNGCERRAAMCSSVRSMCCLQFHVQSSFNWAIFFLPIKNHKDRTFKNNVVQLSFNFSFTVPSPCFGWSGALRPSTFVGQHPSSP